MHTTKLLINFTAPYINSIICLLVQNIYAIPSSNVYGKKGFIGFNFNFYWPELVAIYADDYFVFT